MSTDFSRSRTTSICYRVEPLEFGVKLHIALTEQPFPYRIGVFNWEGKVVADTTDAGTPTLDLQLGPPGSYYVAVKQAFQGQVSATAPYRLVSDLRYPGKTPSVAYSATFRPDGHEANDYDLAPDEDADYELGNGRLTIRLKQGGSAKDPSFAGYWLPIGANISNFTLALDARIANDTDAGYDIKFRSPNDADDETGYHLVVNPKEQQIKLRSVNIEDDVHHSLGKWITSPVINAQGSNRIVVRAQGDDIRVNVNGTELIHARDSSFAEGAISFQALGWGDQPPAVNFGNILVTTP